MAYQFYKKVLDLPKQVTQTTFNTMTGVVKTTMQVPQQTVNWVKQKTCGNCGKNMPKQ